MHQSDRKPARSVGAAFSGLMVFNATCEIRCHADIEGVVGAEKQVDPGHQTTMASSATEGNIRLGRAEGGWETKVPRR